MSEKITITLDGKPLQAEGPLVISSLLGEEDFTYENNPVVASRIAGELKSLSYKLEWDAEVETIRLFTPLGKRVYRHSICHLLSYAAAKLYPEKHFIIRHSLGDGYFFRFDGYEATEADVTALTQTMNKAVKASYPFIKRKYSHKNALAYAEKRGMIQLAELLTTSNESSISLFGFDDVYMPTYEALVPNTAVLTKWELRKYDDGLLLRYPRSADLVELAPFQENNALYETLKKDGETCAILGVESIGELNYKIMNGEIKKVIELSEALLGRSISVIASKIRDKGTVKVICIAGPSSSGKTTSSLKLASQLQILGYDPIKISLDDYYKPVEEIPLDEDGRTDFEAFDALNIPYFRAQIEDLIAGKPVHLVKYSFKTRTRVEEAKETVLKPNSVIIVEGIHGLNPSLLPTLEDSLIYRIYISALTTVNIDDHNRISTTDNRIIRRLVRDSRTRGVTATETLSMWNQVERGEKIHIFPNQKNADAMINTALSYELAALAPEAMNLLRSVKPEDKEAYLLARRLIKFLSLFCVAGKDDIPSDSVLREFLGGSIYGAI